MKLPAGHGWATILPSMDFETYSEAGYEWNGTKWQRLAGASKYGLPAVGSAVYTEHPSAEVLSLAYDLKDGRGPRVWVPGMPPPTDLFDHLARGGLISVWNSSFERQVWTNICNVKYGWPLFYFGQIRDAMAKARAWGLPGSLDNAAQVLDVPIQKIKGKTLLDKFSCPRQPTENDPRTRVLPTDEPAAFGDLLAYNVGDIQAEESVALRVPDLDGEELEFQLLTDEMNARGIAVDLESVEACIATLEQAYAVADSQLAEITGGAVESATQGARMIAWLATQDVHTKSLDAEHRKELLARPWHPDSPVKKALELFDLVTGAGVKKVYAMKRMANKRGRLCNLYIYHGARTGRDTGADVQPQNLVKQGHTWHDGSPWSWEYAEETLRIIREGRAREVFTSPVLAVSGCIRSLFVAAPGHDLICSDYSSIEAVVTAALAGEQWRLDAFARGDDIYLLSAGKVMGRTLEWYSANGGKKHPDRQKMGKPMELGCGFGGWVGALRAFGFQGTDDEAKKLVVGWRDASPAIVEFWGGQVRGKPWNPDRAELYGLEGMAISAVRWPGQEFTYRQITYFVIDDVLYCRLPSGRCLAYHRPRLEPSTRWPDQVALSFEGWNSNPKKGPPGWQRMELYGGLLCENVVQATARDLLRSGVIALERAGYPIVLRVHDEIAAEVPEGWGSIEEFERLMATVPTWAEGWPIKAAGGWRGKRYRKD